MDKILNLIATLQAARDGLNERLDAATREAEGIILAMNRSQMYDEGKDRNGNAIQPSYAPATVQRKKRKGQPTNRVTLRDSGDFHLSLYIEYTADGFEIKADDFKTPFLTKRYGSEVLGLTDENLGIICERYYQPRIEEYYNELLKQ